MSDGKEMSPQQNIDNEAVSILPYKLRKTNLLFREQQKDYGVDCELELFEENPNKPGFKKTTGNIFKGQIKGMDDVTKKTLSCGQKIAKSFDIADLFYWYNQMTIPVVIFLVDIETEEVFWTEFFYSKQLRDAYHKAVENNQKQLTIHFSTTDTLSKNFGGMIDAVNHAMQRIALQNTPTLKAIEEHVRGLDNADEEMRRLSSRVSTSRLEVFKRAVENKDHKKVQIELNNIILSADCNVTTKCYTLYNYESFYFQEKTMDMAEAAEQLIKRGNPNFDTETIGLVFSSILSSSIKINKIAKQVLDFYIASQITNENKENSLYALSFNEISRVKTFELWREINSITKNLTEQTKDKNSLEVAHACALSSYYLVEAFIPLIGTISEYNIKLDIFKYCLTWLQLGLAFGLHSGEDYLSGKLIHSVAKFAYLLEDIETIKNELTIFFKEDPNLLNIFNETVERMQLFYKNIEQNVNINTIRDVEIIDEMARKVLTTMGIDVDGIMSDKVIDKTYGHIVKKTFSEIDLTDYLIDCRHRCIFPSRWSGVSDLMNSVGLAFAASRKNVGCVKKSILNNRLSFYLSSDVEKFKNENCVNCKEIDPHPSDWEFSYQYYEDIKENLIQIFPAQFGIQKSEDEP